MRLANASNGLAYPHDDVCMFLSQTAHHKRLGYFRIDAMPHRGSIHLMRGGTITVVDGRRRKGLSDALSKGLPTWCMVFNRAARFEPVQVCDWQTPAMVAASRLRLHKPAVQALRRLMRAYPPTSPAVIGQNVFVDCQVCDHDDSPEMLPHVAWAAMEAIQ
ncbi:MAG: hypothetical protein MJH10_12275 [Epibacterium sp.]|nr:hypothetical protein [Epibacterium sp.]NQX74325.1 hypothetical protein [Epibacterium sp.]